MNIMFFGSGEFPLHAFRSLNSMRLLQPTLINHLALTTSISREKYKKKDDNAILSYAKSENLSFY